MQRFHISHTQKHESKLGDGHGLLSGQNRASEF